MRDTRANTESPMAEFKAFLHSSCSDDKVTVQTEMKNTLSDTVDDNTR